MISRINIAQIKPYFYQFFGRVLPQLVGIGISSAIVKNAGIEVFGQYSLLVALIAVTYGVLGAALDTDFQRSCDAGNVSSVLASKFVVWVIALPVLVMIGLIADFAILATMLLFAGTLMRQSIETRITYDRILGEDARSVFPRLLPVLVFLGSLYIVRPSSIDVIAGLFAFSWMTGMVYIVHLYRKVRIDFSHSLRSIYRVVPIWFSLVMTQVYGNLDLYVIRFFHSDEVVGVYKIAYTFAGMAMPVAGVFSFIFLSKISEALNGEDIGRSKMIIKHQLLLNSLLGLGLILFMVILFPYLAKYLYGVSGDAAIFPARILSIAMTLNMLTMVFSYTLLALYMERAIALMTAVGGVFYLVMAFVLVPGYAANGAAVAMFLTYLFLLSSYYWLYRNRLAHRGVDS